MKSGQVLLQTSFSSTTHLSNPLIDCGSAGTNSRSANALVFGKRAFRSCSFYSHATFISHEQQRVARMNSKQSSDCNRHCNLPFACYLSLLLHSLLRLYSIINCHPRMNVFRPSRLLTTPGLPKPSLSCKSWSAAGSEGVLAMKRFPFSRSLPMTTPNSGPFLPCMMV